MHFTKTVNGEVIRVNEFVVNPTYRQIDETTYIDFEDTIT